MHNYEKLGVFYLGKEFDLDAGEKTESHLLYDSKDLCTHAVVVGMTGSGKTGLCIGLLEEAGMDNIPAIVIDPKGDIANLLLTFPNLSPEDFRPWVDEGQAVREGQSVEVFATSEANKWKKGLAKWEQDGSRIKTFRDNVELRVYTPGSNTGRPLTILKSFAAPSPEVQRDSDALRERISTATSGLLSLLGIDADPIRSKEHILISRILENAWTGDEPKDLDVGKLILQIQSPPFNRVGIMDLDTFFPSKERMELAMTLNNLLASPSFASWMEGEPLNIKQLLHNDDGKPCISILSISHLNDQERMFFVTVLLNEVLSWMRTQAGTSSLRAILYMDEVFGYFPPSKNPPSKQPMLTLLKQARAFGLGVVLATQNPVDLDYKGLSNTGTWFLGRLQTERDKMRVLEGLEGASAQSGASFDRQRMEQVLAGLGSRRFLMNNVHDDEPVVFETRWVMSYLRGPLTRSQIQELVRQNGFDPEVESKKAAKAKAATQMPASRLKKKSEPEIDPRQLIPSEIGQKFVEPTEDVSEGERLIYRPALMGSARLHYVRASYKVDEWKEVIFVSHAKGNELPDEIWEKSEEVHHDYDYTRRPPEEAEFGTLGDGYQKAKNYKTWEKSFKNYLYRDQPMQIWRCQDFKLYSEPNETLRDFKIRLEQVVSEERDLATEKIRKRYASKFSTLRDRIRRAEDKIEVEESQYKQSRMSSYLNIGSTIMGALLGRRTTRSATTSMRSYGRASKEKDDIARAKDNLEDLQNKFEDLEREFNDAINEVAEKVSLDQMEFEDLSVPPRKSDISIENLTVVWLPWKVDRDGIAAPIY